MAAVVANRSRILLPVSKHIDNSKSEMKYQGSHPESKKSILSALGNTNAVVTYVFVDKYDFNSEFYNHFGNDLYVTVFRKLMENLGAVSPVKDLNRYLDNTSAIKIDTIKQIISEIDYPRILKYGKYNSRDNKCIQIADFVAGTIKGKLEFGTNEFYELFEERIRCP